MGTLKHLLMLGSSKPIYASLAERCRLALPEAKGCCLSLRQFSQLGALGESYSQLALSAVFDTDLEDDNGIAPDVGPAAGLLAAHRAHPTATWLVVACDYPLITTRELNHLYQDYEAPLTCFKNASGWPEPLVGIWSPEALAHLESNVMKGITGPKSVVRDFNGKIITALNERSLFNTNTSDDWDKAVKMAASMYWNE